MASNKKLAEQVLELVGGKDNITYVTHCITRLRFNLKDESAANEDALRHTKGVVGVNKTAGQYQVIIGSSVPDVYDELLGLIGVEKGDGSEPEDKQNLISGLMKLISGIMMPVLPALIACGLINAVNTLLTFLGVVANGDSAYTLLNGMGQACMYFFPVLVGASTAKFFGIDQFIGAVIGAIMVYPSFVSASTDGTVFSFFGLNLTVGSYANTVFPAIVAVWFASVLYKFVKKVLPEVISYALTPAITVAITAPLALFLIGPAINAASSVVCQAILAVYGFSPVLCGMVLAPLFGLVLIPLGLHWALMVVAINNVVTLGSDPILGLVCCSMSVFGACLAYGFRSTDPDQRSLGFSTALTAVFGITEPALYGVILPNKKIVIANMVTGVVCGAIPALFGTHTFTMAGSGIFSFPGYINPSGDMNSLIGAVIANVVGAILCFVVTYVMYKPDDPISIDHADAAAGE